MEDGHHIAATAGDDVGHLLQLAGLVFQRDGQVGFAAAHDEAAGDDAVEDVHVDVAAGDEADDLLALDGQLVEERRRHRHCASLGQGLLAYYAARKRDEGLGLEELKAWLEDNKLHLCHWFTVNDLMYLKRGGRINAATAIMGTMLSIKPILHVDNEGHLISVGKARGRKASIAALADKAAELGQGYDNSLMFISHGDCLEDAQALAELVKERCGVKEVYINYVGAVIGSHSGPGTLALFFLGQHR